MLKTVSNTGVFMIAVQGKQSSTFSISPYYNEKDNIFMIVDGMTMTG